MNVRAIPRAAVELVAELEGVKLTTYQDVVGIWTIGAGHTGPDVKPGLKITMAKAKQLLANDLLVAAKRLHGAVKAEVLEGLTEGQWSALLSFVFNLGANKSWKIWKVLNAGKLDAVPAQMRRFVNAGGHRVQGLVNRRNREAELFEADLGAVEEAPPSSVTRATPTPPTPEPVKPLAESKTFVTNAATAVAAAGAGVATVTQTIAPYAAGNEFVGKAQSVLIGIAAGLAVLGLIFAWFKHRGAKR